MPQDAADQLHVELVPRRQGLSFEAWLGAELVMWESEKVDSSSTVVPLCSISLTKIAKVEHRPESCVRLKIYSESKEAKYESLTFASEDEAKAWCEALTESIEFVRQARGRGGARHTGGVVPAPAGGS